MPENAALLTSAEVALLLRVHPKHLYRLMRRGLPGHRHGRGHWRFRQDEVLAWADARNAAPHQPAGIELTLPIVGAGTRVCVGRVADRWVGHAMPSGLPRAADALRTIAPDRVETLLPAHTLEENVLVAGCAPILGLVLDRIEAAHRRGRCHWISANSNAALDLLADGMVHVAGVHLQDPLTGRGHDEIVRDRLGHSDFRIVELVRWRAGLATRPGDGRAHVGEFQAARWVQREPGAGAHNVLHRALSSDGVAPQTLVTARIARDHADVAHTIAVGAADVGVCVEPVAHAHGLSLIPLEEERFELVVLTRAQPASVPRLLEALDSPALRREVAASGRYDTAGMGHGRSP